ncbi:hypothetical protein F5887DRAFT_1081038 [Amanita rubescens]|nr:hypothetical protein F5887DRAFT_1081038 [Amanita rubescens]
MNPTAGQASYNGTPADTDSSDDEDTTAITSRKVVEVEDSDSNADTEKVSLEEDDIAELGTFDVLYHQFCQHDKKRRTGTHRLFLNPLRPSRDAKDMYSNALLVVVAVAGPRSSVASSTLGTPCQLAIFVGEEAVAAADDTCDVKTASEALVKCKDVDDYGGVSTCWRGQGHLRPSSAHKARSTVSPDLPSILNVWPAPQFECFSVEFVGLRKINGLSKLSMTVVPALMKTGRPDY